MPEPLEQSRAALGDAAIYTLRRAAELMPGRDADNRAWLKRVGLVRKVERREVVIWGDVIALLREFDQPKKPAARPVTPEGRRVKL